MKARTLAVLRIPRDRLNARVEALKSSGSPKSGCSPNPQGGGHTAAWPTRRVRAQPGKTVRRCLSASHTRTHSPLWYRVSCHALPIRQGCSCCSTGPVLIRLRVWASGGVHHLTIPKLRHPNGSQNVRSLRSSSGMPRPIANTRKWSDPVCSR
jgi:hypothetical protein